MNLSERIEAKKGVLWWDIYDILKSKKPKFLLLENVDRLLKSPSSQRGRDFGVMLKCLNELGYLVEWRVINAAEYGHPQRRRRTFIFGARKDTTYTKKTMTSNKEFLKDGFFSKQFKVSDEHSIEEKYYLSEFKDIKEISDNFLARFENAGFMNLSGEITTIKSKPLEKKGKTLRETITETKAEIPEIVFINENLEKWQYMKGAKKITRKAKNGHTYNYAEGAIAFPDKLESPSRTMLTSEGTLNRSTHVVKDPQSGRLRLLMPEECEELNEFPRGWTNCEMPNRWRYFMMGNALVVGVVEKLGITLDKLTEQD